MGPRRPVRVSARRRQDRCSWSGHADRSADGPDGRRCQALTRVDGSHPDCRRCLCRQLLAAARRSACALFPDSVGGPGHGRRWLRAQPVRARAPPDRRRDRAVDAGGEHRPPLASGDASRRSRAGIRRRRRFCRADPRRRIPAARPRLRSLLAAAVGALARRRCARLRGDVDRCARWRIQTRRVDVLA